MFLSAFAHNPRSALLAFQAFSFFAEILAVCHFAPFEGFRF